MHENFRPLHCEKNKSLFLQKKKKSNKPALSSFKISFFGFLKKFTSTVYKNKVKNRTLYNVHDST